MDLNYKEFGQGDPIIILHGLFGTLDNWQTVAKQLAEDYSVFILDQRNHGRSPHVDHIDYPSMADDLHHFMETQWIHKSYIIGHSMGGKTAMQFALHYPDMVEKLVVVDIAPKAYEGGHQAIIDALFALDLKSVESRKWADDFLKTKIEDFGVRQFLLKNLTRSKSGGYEWKMNLSVIAKDYPKILEALSSDEKFENPTLFIRGGKSDYIADNEEEHLKNHFAKARVETVPNVGHWVHAEAPDALLTLVRGFFEE